MSFNSTWFSGVPWPEHHRHVIGKINRPLPLDASLVISREVDNGDQEETYMPSRFFFGLLPQTLLDNFFFWQRGLHVACVACTTC